LNQTRLNVPGVSPDARGVMLGRRGLLLFPTIERLVSFFRVYGDREAIDDLLPTLRLVQLKTPLGTREFVVSFGVSSSYQMDRCAAIAKMLGGLTFTGSTRHFVKYRDAASPLGYDSDRLLPREGDVALYHDDFTQAYDEEREVPFRQLVLQLTPQRETVASGDFGSPITAAVRPGLAGAVQGYMYRNGARAQVALVEWPAQSAFDQGTRRLFLFHSDSLPSRIAALMQATPGIEVYESVGANAAVEHGYRHPINLASCLSVLDPESLYLFSGSRGTVDIISPPPQYTDIRTLSQLSVDLSRPEKPPGRGDEPPPTVEVPLRLVPTSEPWRRIRAVAIPWHRAQWLEQLVYVLPPRLLSGTKVHFSADQIVVLGEEGVENIPLGTLLCGVGEAILVAAGYSFLPHIEPEVLREILGVGSREICVFEPQREQPYLLPLGEFRPLAKGVVTAMEAARPATLAGKSTENSPSVLLHYDQLGLFPLWGLPGRRREGEDR
jgi:hypothetical protein